MAKAVKNEAPAGDALSKEEMAKFIENAAKQGTPINGRRINFHFVRRKRKAY